MPSPSLPGAASWAQTAYVRWRPRTQAELQQLPGIGPFCSSLIVVRACAARRRAVAGRDQVTGGDPARVRR
jgi:endonuclease III